MKKFLLPLLICIIGLSSCSQALYKHNYDWVKVERNVSEPGKKLQPEENPQSNSEASNVIETTSDSMTVHADVAVAPIVNVQQDKAIAERPRVIREEIKGKRVVEKPEKREKKKRVAKAIQKIDWEEVGTWAYEIGLIVALIWMGLNPDHIVTIIVQIIVAALSLDAFVFLIYGICWVFKEFLLMMA